jgi:putative ABC transport system substrate-binding protein
MKRREFITLLGGAATVWPLAARAQQPALPVIGVLGSGSADGFANRIDAFRKGLSELGFIEGRNVAIEFRWDDGQYERLPELASDLLRHRVSVLVTITGIAARAAKAASNTVPIVFGTGVDPVAAGLVASLNRPGGNVTGVANLNVEVAPKRLELLRELLPAARNIGHLVNPARRPPERYGGGGPHAWPSTSPCLVRQQRTGLRLGICRLDTVTS